MSIKIDKWFFEKFQRWVVVKRDKQVELQQLER